MSEDDYYSVDVLHRRIYISNHPEYKSYSYSGPVWLAQPLPTTGTSTRHNSSGSVRATNTIHQTSRGGKYNTIQYNYIQLYTIRLQQGLERDLRRDALNTRNKDTT